MPSATPQQQHQPQLAPQPVQQVRRMTSFTQRFRSSNKTASSNSTVSSPQEQQQEQSRPRTVYVPTHAAASFARTVSPLSQTRIDERDELRLDAEEASARTRCGTQPMLASTATRSKRSSHGRTNSSGYPSRTNSYTTGTGTGTTNTSTAAARSASHQATPRNHMAESPSSDFTSFIAEAEANDRAFRTRWAQREKEREREWASSNMAGLPNSFKGTQRDSAYYSVGSMSRSSMSGSGPQKHMGAAGHERLSAPAPLPMSTSTRTLNHKQSRTLGRRISEYFKPSPEGSLAGSQGVRV